LLPPVTRLATRVHGTVGLELVQVPAPGERAATSETLPAAVGDHLVRIRCSQRGLHCLAPLALPGALLLAVPTEGTRVGVAGALLELLGADAGGSWMIHPLIFRRNVFIKATMPVEDSH